MGKYYWLRVPMGLKAAPSYFQGALATCVLVGLIYQICELYIDDIIVHGKTEDEFVDNLRQVFTRLKTKGLVVNPEKCFIGMTEVEFVGHTINSEGLTSLGKRSRRSYRSKSRSTERN